MFQELKLKLWNTRKKQTQKEIIYYKRIEKWVCRKKEENNKQRISLKLFLFQNIFLICFRKTREGLVEG